ncbi:MAG: NAD-dependent epimerase/dehydratase family protein [Saprospiraceae bacterium]|nr:NAD-dependent epimerase/dehydratase family protein [Saprospiraceae bacterium]
MRPTKILITGANGQVGTALAAALREHYGEDKVLCTDIRKPKVEHGPFEMLDILNVQRMAEIIEDHHITQVYHLAAVLSANGEWNPKKTWNVNLNGQLSILELAHQYQMDKIFFPSTIAVFGKTTPQQNTPQHTAAEPVTVYGMSKLAGELWCQYYHQRYAVDVRSLRYPGIIGWQSLPGGGTTDYAVEIFHQAIKSGQYECYLNADITLPMLYMDDAIRATIELMEAPEENISIRTSYNLAGIPVSPKRLYDEIIKYYPDFKLTYNVDFRQEIANTWTESIDDHDARQDWGWKEKFDITSMSQDMIMHLKHYYHA